MENFNSGRYVNQGTYKCFVPEKINKMWEIHSMELISLLGKADRELGRLDMFSNYIPNVDLFISMHVAKEATQSSKIEGTKTNLEEALLSKEDVKDENRDDWEEVQNYILALNLAIEELKELPFSSRLIKMTHKILLQGVRGEHKLPGEFRRSQNWIGGASLQDAVFIPPNHNTIHELMGDLENFAHSTEFYFPDLLKVAFIHYQFETIHPFLDGNGRIGRLMITLLLVEKGILKKPILYLSDFFSRHRTLYYDNLMKVREKNDLAQWFKFFLVGVIETARSSINTFSEILKLKEEIDERVASLGNRSENARLVIKTLFQRPVLAGGPEVQVITGLSLTSSYKLIEDLENLDIIHRIPTAKRGRLYLFKAYVELFM